MIAALFFDCDHLSVAVKMDKSEDFNRRLREFVPYEPYGIGRRAETICLWRRGWCENVSVVEPHLDNVNGGRGAFTPLRLRCGRVPPRLTMWAPYFDP